MADKSQVSSSKNFIRHDTALMHFAMHYDDFLTRNERWLLKVIWSWTDRFNASGALLTYKKLSAGQAPYVPVNGGIPPLGMYPNRYYTALRALKKLGIVHVHQDSFVIDYSIMASDLIREPEVQKRVIAQHRSSSEGPRTPEQAIEFVNRLYRYSDNQYSDSEQYRYSDNRFDLTKQNNTIGAGACEEGMKSTDSVEQALASAAALKAKVRNKRLTRGTIVDHGKLFQTAWHTAMKEKYTTTVAVPWGQEQIVSRVKTVIIAPAMEANIDVEAFARFIVMSWNKIGKKRFPKFANYPKFPAIQFVLKLADAYFESFASGRDDVGDVQVEQAEDLAAENRKLRDKLEQKEKALAAVTGVARTLEKENVELKRVRIKPKVRPKGEASLVDVDYDTRMKGYLK